MKRKTAFVFPGQGSQYLGMGEDFYNNFNLAKEKFNLAEEILRFDIKKLCFTGPEEELKITYTLQPAIFILSSISSLLLKENGIIPAIVAGHSLGEYSANFISEVISFEDGLKITRKRGELMQKASDKIPGGMAAIIGLSCEKIKEICKVSSNSGIVECANFNSSEQIVISGEKNSLKKAMELATSWGAKKVVELKVSAPFHSSLMKEVSQEFSEYLDGFNFFDAKIPIVANFNAVILYKKEEIKDALKKQIISPVLWKNSIEKILEMGIDTFIEVGPGKVLSGLIKKITNSAKTFNVEDSKTLKKVMEEVK